jgi:uncharacterized membrane protein
MDTTVPPSQAAVADVLTEDKTVAILSYVTIFGFIAAIFVHQSRKTQLGAFHLRQVLGMVLTGVVGGVAAVVPILGWIVWFFLIIGMFVLWLLGLISALKGDMRPVPLLGEHYQRWFAGVFA